MSFLQHSDRRFRCYLSITLSGPCICHEDDLNLIFGHPKYYIYHLERSSMNKPRIFPKSLKSRGQISKLVNLANFLSLRLYTYVNHMETNQTYIFDKN